MDLTNAIIAYYEGEKSEALVLTFAGVVVSLLLYLLLTRYSTDLARGLIYPVVLFVLIAVFAGSYNAYNNARRLQVMPKRYAEDPAMFVSDELTRFEGRNGVNAWWFPLNVAWSVLIVSGVLLYFLRENNHTKGIALGLVFLGFSGLLIDGFARERAAVYTLHLYRANEEGDMENR